MTLTRETSIGYLSNWAARLFTRAIERRLAPAGIATAYLPVLFALGDGTAMTQKALAQRAAVEQPTMAATLKRMERDGLVQRRPDPSDRRSALVALTPLASGQLDRVQTLVEQNNAMAMANLQPAEQQALLTHLLQVIAALEADEAAAQK
ncbi:MAG TPA: MarR family transcriptional regulator [Devosia sp.]|nr:MarR family transcriptional regulator [Devosia sp.]